MYTITQVDGWVYTLVCKKYNDKIVYSTIKIMYRGIVRFVI